MKPGEASALASLIRAAIEAEGDYYAPRHSLDRWSVSVHLSNVVESWDWMRERCCGGDECSDALRIFTLRDHAARGLRQLARVYGVTP